MITLSVRTNFKDVQSKINSLSNEVSKRAIPAAINKVAAKAKTEMTRQITSEFNIKADNVRSRLRLVRASKTFDKWKAVLDPFLSTSNKGRSLNLIHFIEKSVTLAEGRRRVKRGTANQLRFQIKKQGGKKTITGAFIANKGRTVFVRLSDERLPIAPLQTIDVPQMFNTKRISQAVILRIEQELPIELERAIHAAVIGAIR